MTVKTFRAPTIAEALARVKATIGPSALIIETRQVAPRGLFGFLRRPVVEIVVGIEDLEPPRRPAAPRPTASLWQGEMDVLHGLGKEIGQIRDALRRAADAPPSDLPAPFGGLHQRLVEQGLDALRAATLVEESRAELARSGSGEPLAHLRAALARRFRVAPEAAPRLTQGGLSLPKAAAPPAASLRVVALLGPPGAGKTTLLVKLASRAALSGGGRVALATMDFFRVGALEQLRAYSEILGVPCHVLGGLEDVPKVLEAARNGAWLFVDTPGLASGDLARLRKLAAWLGAFPAVERRLVLSAATEPRAALAAIEGYRAVGFDTLAFTKLDEARRHAVLLLAAEAADVPVTVLSTGQDVAGDLEPARPERLAGLLLGA